MNLIGNETLDIGILTDALAATLTTAKIDLFKNDYVPDRTTVLGAMTVANYAGYAQGAITWNDPSRADDGTIEVVGTCPEFRPSDGVTPNLVYGVYVRQAAAGALLGAARFDGAPLPMQSALDAIVLTIRLSFTANGVVVVVS